MGFFTITMLFQLWLTTVLGCYSSMLLEPEIFIVSLRISGLGFSPMPDHLLS